MPNYKYHNISVYVEYFCSECNEYKESENIEFDSDVLTTQYGSHTTTTGECYSTCVDCGHEIDIIETY